MIQINNLLKRFGVSATLSSPDESFVLAVWRLTAWYTLVMTGVLTVFSAAVYGLFRRALGPEPAEVGSSITIEHHIRYDAVESLFAIILYADVICFVVTMALSYVLAKRTLAPLAKSFARQRQFVADTAHELRTPLAVMKAGHEVLLQKERTTDMYVSGITSSLEEIDRLVVLTNQLLLLASAGQPVESNSVCQLSDVVLQKVALFTDYAERKSVRLTAEAEPNIVVAGDAHRYGQVVLNLVKNAVDYNRRDGTVLVKLYTADTDCVLVVSDTGIGIPAEKLSRIFDRFYKVDTARTVTTESGSGLGLSIVSEIVHTMGGTIKVVSKPSQGTTFTVTFPAR